MQTATLLLIGFLVMAEGPKFEAVLASDAEIVSGSLVSWTSNGAMKLGDRSIAVGQLVELRQIGKIRPAPPTERPYIVLTNGDRWVGHVVSIQNDTVNFMADFGSRQSLALPLASVSSIGLAPSKDQSSVDRKKSTDVIQLTNGDLITGTVTSLIRGSLAIEESGSTKRMPVERIAFIGLSTDLLPLIAAKVPFAGLVLMNGSRVSLAGVTLQDGRLVGTAANNQVVRLLLSDVVHMAMISGTAVYLSDSKPIKFEHTPFFNVHWPLALNRNTANGPLRLGHDTYDRGIGMHSQSRVTYAIPEGALRFEACVGLDSVSGRRGNVRIFARLDGKEALGPVEISGNQLPQRIVVSIPAGSRELSLEVEFGKAADVQDHVNWGDARIIRKP